MGLNRFVRSMVLPVMASLLCGPSMAGPVVLGHDAAARSIQAYRMWIETRLSPSEIPATDRRPATPPSGDSLTTLVLDRYPIRPAPLQFVNDPPAARFTLSAPLTRPVCVVGADAVSAAWLDRLVRRSAVDHCFVVQVPDPGTLRRMRQRWRSMTFTALAGHTLHQLHPQVDRYPALLRGRKS